MLYGFSGLGQSGFGREPNLTLSPSTKVCLGLRSALGDVPYGFCSGLSPAGCASAHLQSSSSYFRQQARVSFAQMHAGYGADEASRLFGCLVDLGSSQSTLSRAQVDAILRADYLQAVGAAPAALAAAVRSPDASILIRPPVADQTRARPGPSAAQVVPTSDKEAAITSAGPMAPPRPDMFAPDPGYAPAPDMAPAPHPPEPERKFPWGPALAGAGVLGLLGFVLYRSGKKRKRKGR